MPRNTDPKLDVRFSGPGYAAVCAAAQSIGVKPGTLVRECAERYATTLARDVSEGRVSLARRSAPVRTASEPPAVAERPAAPLNDASTPSPATEPSPSRAVPSQGIERADLFRLAEARRAVR